MKRRTFLYSTAITGAGLGIAGYYYWNIDSRWKKEPLIYPYILSQICDEETLRKIGIAYRKSVPAENAKEKLLNLLNDKLDADPSSTDDHLTLVKKLELKVEREFKEKKIITISGWVLSITEARQCALFSLS